MKSVLKRIHLYYYLFLVAVFFIILYPFLWYSSRDEKNYHLLNTVRKLTASLPSFFSGIIYRYQFKENISWDKTYIVCANHSSSLDIFALSLMMKNNNFFFMGKEELLDSFFTKVYFKTIDVPVNRNSKIASYKAFMKASDKLKKGMSLLIFPEGKIGDEYPPVLHPFKNGPFKMAISHEISILPVSIVNTWDKLWDDGKRMGSKPGICNIIVHEPIDTSLMSEKDEEILKNNVFEIVHSGLNYNSWKELQILDSTI